MVPLLQGKPKRLKLMEWHIGCSGFHYKEWKNTFYPEKMPPAAWFE